MARKLARFTSARRQVIKGLARQPYIAAIAGLMLVVITVSGFVAWIFYQKNNESAKSIYGPQLNSYDECMEKGGVSKGRDWHDKCYYDGMVYYEVVVNKLGNEHRLPPEELKTYKDCLRNEGNKITSNNTCKSWNGKTYYYQGSKVDSYGDCIRAGGFALESNPPQCYGPDGTHHIGPRS